MCPAGHTVLSLLFHSLQLSFVDAGIEYLFAFVLAVLLSHTTEHLLACFRQWHLAHLLRRLSFRAR